MEKLKIRKGELVVLAARSGCGKSTFALNFALKGSGTKKKLYCSLEMTSSSLISKMVACMDGNISTSAAASIHIADDPTMINLEGLEEQIREFKYEVIIIDHLQIFNGKIRTLTKELKKLCIKYNVIIFALSQLNRKAAEAEPEPGMLRDSGTIEQDADQIGFIKPHTLKVAKNRSGACFEIGLDRDFANSKFGFGEARIKKCIILCEEMFRKWRNSYYYRQSPQGLDDYEKCAKLDKETAIKYLKQMDDGLVMHMMRADLEYRSNKIKNSYKEDVICDYIHVISKY